MTLSFDEKVLVQTGEYLALAEIGVYVVPVFTFIPILAGMLSALVSIVVMSVFGIFWYAFMHFTIYRMSDWMFPYANRLALKEIKLRMRKYEAF